MNNSIEIEKKFKFSGELSKRKLKEYLPAMIITNLSVLLLTIVDSLVVGNILGKDALSSVNIFLPAISFIGIISALISSGAGTCLSVGMGKIDLEGLLVTKCTVKFLMVIGAIITGVIQIPFVALVISSYHLSPEMNSLVWSYAIGVMISMPFGLISTVGSIQLQITGKMKVLMTLTCIEGGVNLFLDLLFIGPLGMGVAGAGFGTAGANIIRATLTVLYLAKKTDIYYSKGVKPSLKESLNIVFHGLPEAANVGMLAIQGYAIVAIALSVFGEDGGTIKGVCAFVITVATVVISGIQGAMRPMIGLYCGADDRKGLQHLMKQGIYLTVFMTGIILIFFELFPELIYSIYGIAEIPEGGVLSFRLITLSIVFKGFNTLFRLYFTNRKALRFTTIITIVGNALLPVFALLLSKFLPAPWIWLSYLLSETVILLVFLVRYFRMLREDKEAENRDEVVLHLTTTPEEAIETSRAIRKYANEQGIDRKFAFRVSLCLEEMVAYAVKSHKSENVSLQIMIRFFKDGAMLMIIDDGQCIFLDREEEKQKIITSNYGLLKSVSKSVDYQYILNLNYTVCRY